MSAAGVNDEHRALAQALAAGEKRAVWLGALAARHVRFADLRSLAAALAALTGASLGRIAEGGNAVGAYLAGAVPHREAGARSVAQPGLNAATDAQGSAARLPAHSAVSNPPSMPRRRIPGARSRAPSSWWR